MKVKTVDFADLPVIEPVVAQSFVQRIDPMPMSALSAAIELDASTHEPAPAMNVELAEHATNFNERGQRLEKGDWYAVYREFMTHDEIAARFPDAKGLEAKRGKYESAHA